MSFSLDIFGELTTTEARERDLTGYVGQTVDIDQIIDTDGSFEDTITVTNFLHLVGIHFTSPDTTVSVFNDGSIEAIEFIEGNRVYIDNGAKVNVVFLREN